MFNLRFKNQFFFFFPQDIPECKVETTYVVNPSLFFVRKMASKSEFEQLEKDLRKYGDNKQNVEPSIKLELGMRKLIMMNNCSRPLTQSTSIICRLQITCVSLNRENSMKNGSEAA